MGVVAVAGKPVTRRGLNPATFACYAAALAWGTLVLLAAAHHEPWADEAQSWLLARDAGIAELWTRLMRYEGSPGLWQTLLHFLTGAGLPYGGINFVSALIAWCAAGLILFRAPLPLAIRIALPFTFFFAYQYAVVARSYVLIPVLVFACAALCRDAARHKPAITMVLCLLACVSVHGFVVSAAIWAWLQATVWRRSISAWTTVYAAVLAIAAVSAWPAADGAFLGGLYFSWPHIAATAGEQFVSAFTGEPFSTVAVILFSFPFLRRGGTLAVFGFCAAALCAIAGILYSQVWHHGLLFLSWLFAMWVAAYRARMSIAPLAALAIVIAPQCWWTIASIRYDWRQPYSGAAGAAAYLRARAIPERGLYAVGYACTAIQPYFARNIFANVNEGRPQAYWDWSARNHVNRDSERLDRLAPEYVLIGYKNDFERGVWTANVMRAGYGLVQHFEANTFWKTAIFEPESYDLYARGFPASKAAYPR